MAFIIDPVEHVYCIPAPLLYPPSVLPFLLPQVMQSLRFALQPAVVDIAVDWKVPKGVSVTPLSQPISVLFQGQRSLIYAQLTGEVR